MAPTLTLTHLEAVLQGLSTPWFVRDREGRFIHACERFAERVALAGSELPGRSSADLFPAKLVQDSLAADRVVFEKGQPTDREEPRPWDPSGGAALVRRLPLFGGEGEVTAVLGIYDAPHSRDREIRLRTHLEEAVSGGGWEWDTATGRVYWTEGMFRLNGLEPDSLVPTPGDLWRGFPPQSRDQIESALSTLLAEKRAQTIVVLERSRPDRPRTLCVTFCPLLKEDKVARIYGSMIDVSNQARMDELLASMAHAFEAGEGETLLRAVAHHLADSLDATELILALASGEEGDCERLRTLVRIVDGRLSEPVEYRITSTPCETVLREGRCLVSGDLEKLYPDDPLLAGIDACAYVGTALHDRSGRHIGVLSAFLRDEPKHPAFVDTLLRLAASRVEVELDRVSARRSLRHQETELLGARRAEAVAELAKGIAHDFNNLLTVINGNSRVLSEEVGGAGELGDLAREIEEAGQEGAELARQLIDLGRETTPLTQPLELGHAVETAGLLLRPLLGPEIELIFDTGGGERWVRADPSHLEELLLTLAMHARDAMPSGGTLRVGVKADDLRRNAGHGIPSSVPPGRYAVLEVQDSSERLPEQLRDRPSEPFSMTDERQSAASGLSTIRSVVNSFSGHLIVKSAAGQGTLLRIYLPLLEGRALAGADAVVKRAQPDGAKQEILVVEDDAALRSFVRDALEREGFSVLEAEDGFTAEDIIRSSESRPRLLLTDVVMPGRSGKATAMAVRQHRPEIGVLFMSGFTSDVLAPDEVERLHAELLLKPFTSDVLLDRVRAMLATDVGT